MKSKVEDANHRETATDTPKPTKALKRSILPACLAAAAFLLTACSRQTQTQPQTQIQTQTDKISQPVCVDLTKDYTARLTDSLNSPASVKENNLTALLRGRQVLGGVPFEIEGVVQLSGKKIQEWCRQEFPESVKDIAIGRTCSRLDLLHGAGGVYDGYGVTIAELVLHYADTSVSQIEIKNGMHVRDWWGDPRQTISATNSVLAWTGTNPAVKQYGGANPGSLRIYRTTFENPRPNLPLTSIDYVSAMRNASPFLIALTVE